MGVLPIIEQGSTLACRGDWPVFYMNDFSRLGLRVSRIDQAMSALRAEGYETLVDGRFAAVTITGYDQVAAILNILTEYAVAAETADLISCVYQG